MRKIVLLVTSIDTGSTVSESGGLIFGNVKPTALVVCDKDGIQVMGVGVEPMGFEQLSAALPELQPVVDGFRRSLSTCST